MAQLKDFEIKIKLIPKEKIIAYKLEEYITLKEYEKLSDKIKKKFKPIYERYRAEYIKEK